MGAQPRSRRDRPNESAVIHAPGEIDRVIARIASRQQGNVTHAQLIRTGVHRRAIASRLGRGWLTPMYRGVYFVGHGEITPKARAMAAVLACGDGAIVSHRSAAYLYQFLPYPAQDHAVEVTVPARALASREGIIVHRTAGFDRRDARTLDNIPITSPARTLLDIAASAPDELDAAFDETIFRQAVRMPQLRELVARSAGRPGGPRAA